MTLQNIESMLMIVMYSMFTILIGLIVGVIILGYIISKISEKKYKIATIKIILSKSITNNDIEESMKNNYTNYKTKSSFSFLAFNEINSRLIAELRDDSYEKYYQRKNKISESEIKRFEKINKKIAEDLMFSNDKISDTLKLVDNCQMELGTKKELRETILIFYNSVLSFCNGQIFEKNQEVFKLKYMIEKLKKKRWITGIIGGILSAIGLISSIKTIWG